MRERFAAGIILLIAFPFLLWAQNWNPVNPNWKYNYVLDGANVITNTIWSDSVFYLNRIMVKCDTCTAALGGPNPCDTCYALKNQPQFLQRKMIQKANGIYNFRDTANLVLNSLGQLNDTWLFDSLQNVNAQIINISVENIFGNMDSVKTILLSTNDTIKFSKNYGILLFPHGYGLNSYYKLAGIEGPNLGEQVPDFRDIYNFDVGDMFEYHGSRGQADGSTFFSWSYIYKYTIVSKLVFGDTLKYQRQGVKSNSYYEYYMGNSYWSNSSGMINDSITFIDSIGNVSNWFNRELLNLSDRNIYLINDNWGWGPFLSYMGYDYMKVYKDSVDRITKSFGYDGTMNFNYYISLDSFPDVMTQYIDCPGGSYIATLQEGLGQTLYSVGCFEMGMGEQLVAYRKGNDTVGVFTPDSIIYGIKKNSFSNEIKVFPNPAKDILNIYSSEILDGKIKLVNLLGQTLLEKTVRDYNVQMHVGNIPNGIYFLSVETRDKKFVRKIVIMK